MFFRFPPIFGGGLIDLAIPTCNKSRQKIFEKLSNFSEKLFFQVATTRMRLTNINITLKFKSRFFVYNKFFASFFRFFRQLDSATTILALLQFFQKNCPGFTAFWSQNLNWVHNLLSIVQNNPAVCASQNL